MDKEINKKEILRCIVGSQAHGLANKDSDYDYRGVFIVPTREILKLGGQIKNTQWIEGDDDNTTWEIGHFLQMATHSNPTTLETFLAPIVYKEMGSAKTRDEIIGHELRELFPYIWSSRRVHDAFIGYGRNQRKKMFDKKFNRPNKYAAAYLRVLYNAYELLNTGTFTIRIADTEIGETIRKFKECEDFTHTLYGDVINICKYWEDKVDDAYENNPKKETDIDKVNEFLLKVRKNNW